MFFSCSGKQGSVSESTEIALEASTGGKNKTMERQNSWHTHGVRTQADASVPAQKALSKLKEGNSRYIEGKPLRRSFDAGAREALAQYGQNPFAAVVGCADSRCPVEILFDVQPGDIFVLRNAGNTCTHAEGSLVGSIEYSVGHLHTNLILILGHTRCGAIAGATAMALKDKENPQGGVQSSTLDKLLSGLRPVALQASLELPTTATAEEVAAHAVKVNVFHTIEKLLTYSKPLREKVREGEVCVQGAIYDIVTGSVEFLGPCPRLPLVLDMDTSLVDDKMIAEEVKNASMASAGGA
jgi:carbonic anhydrase